jgi:hypothetical protein
MVHPGLHRMTTLGLLIAYLAASTVGGLLHDHDETLPCDGAGGHLSHDVADAGVAVADGHATHHDDCTICRCLGQRSLSNGIAPLDSLCQLSVELTLLHASQPASPIARTTHSRAPPLFG